ncbi:NAD-dependent epimerase/dehydratase family protein [Mangrovivirga cuniculi]|uniref:NAD-dependent epimerase n=1 Tax=Mangrovivirga cuniculi TaxID=2715131 RepID=A0A4D7JJJ3_9BACT|nr:NAD-dependent epimerase/dehydratase family protein [Mangrovivirga cuniculi]QCK15771.1 NAD-dependent epimerase [Mangrovivirga cuniculi]
MLQTILGSNGQIGEELVKELNKKYSSDIRLVSRKPRKIRESDTLFPADLMDAQDTEKAIEGSDIVYFCTGLPMDTKMWVDQWPVMVENTINACKKFNAKLVYFDNTYMYPQTSEIQTEEIQFQPNGPKGKVRAETANRILEEIENGSLTAVICRAPEFYGPGKTKSITNNTIIQNIKEGKKAKVFLRNDTLRTWIYTPDASKAMALIGNTPSAYNQTWHLPCDDNRITFKEFIGIFGKYYNRNIKYTILKRWMLIAAGIFNPVIRDAAELLPRYETDNKFDSSKFKNHFPDFQVTSYHEGVEKIIKER